MFGMLISGWLTDRVNRVALLASIFFVRGLSFVLLLNVGANYQTLAIFAVIFGLADYSTVPVTCRSVPVTSAFATWGSRLGSSPAAMPSLRPWVQSSAACCFPQPVTTR
jgi:MFS family permease